MLFFSSGTSDKQRGSKRVEIRIRSIFLASAWVIAIMPATQVAAQSDEEDPTNLIEPQIERVEFDESLIDSDDFEIAVYGGYLAIENLIPTSFWASNSVTTYRKIFRAGFLWPRRFRRDQFRNTERRSATAVRRRARN